MSRTEADSLFYHLAEENLTHALRYHGLLPPPRKYTKPKRTRRPDHQVEASMDRCASVTVYDNSVPRCAHGRMHRNGRTTQGFQRWCCPVRSARSAASRRERLTHNKELSR